MDQPELPDVTDLPKSIDVDLDSWTLEDDPGPMTFKHKGEIFTMASPADIDYFELVEMANELEILRVALGDEDYERLKKLRAPVAKLNHLADMYQKHAGMVQDQGEGDGSP